MRLPSIYIGRFILANGDPRAFTVSADNRSDAAAMIERLGREALGERFHEARFEGVERKQKGVLIVAADPTGSVQKILRQITSAGTVLS